MAQLLYGSINYDALLEALKTGKIKTFRTEKGVRLVNINVWVNDEPDKYDNDASIQLQLKDDYSNTDEKNPYIGNLKKHKQKIYEATAQDFQDETDDDLPF